MSGSTMTLRGKLTAMTLATIGALIILFAVLLVDGKQRMMEDRQNKVRNLVEVAQLTVAHFEAQAKAGKISEDQAKQLAADAIRDMRYDNVEYFWINDLNDLMVMHPIRKDLEGKKLDQLKDKNGKLLFLEFNSVVKNKGAGFVDYLWPKPGADEGVPKISYVMGFKPWGWVIGTGIYIDDVDAQFRRDAIKLLLWGLGIGGFIAVSLLLVSRSIIRTLGGDPAAASAITRRIAAGDLSSPVDCPPGENLLADIRAMQDTLRTMISTIVSNAEHVASAADQLLNASEEVADRARQQSDAASSMAASVEEMAVSIDQVKENAGEAHGISQQSAVISEEGAGVIHTAASEMRKISEAVQASSEIVEDLGRQSDQITSIVNTIREIADQTNLLALNAAIEAARAGEQGRGFAVVADEVRKLAERTSLSTTEIAEMVTKIQNGTRSAVGSMQSGVAKVSKGVELANQAGDSIERIRDGAQRVTFVVNGISDSISEQSQASNDIAQKLETIAQMSEESAIAVRHTADAARRLHTLSGELHEAVARFRT
ncbi:methyl-accepting chemotaxis sensory transducer with Cache sensor [Azonexus fungiphilus]|jgi:methyl-accepting chemotaxis protein|uniref:Methyl-accepting chemotaxis sensory transducer with Cache sensor n=1 Tax=Azonexus fungiphilus TaxID=146940 RepID=A0A495WHZ6_9RHOO|nr:methyl-accepting chemotaxis protein [Azonexus fungiphilus]RKT60724.1 methyl-accepting chemotaxis sensory transducer with Cache sensor [Azonexus fungiphilus]